jgi:hypothetical protein
MRQLGAPVLIGFEATGSYHRPLAYFLRAQGFALRLIPTMSLARTREAMHSSGTSGPNPIQLTVLGCGNQPELNDSFRKLIGER